MRARRNAFTLVETLIALTVMSTGITLLWNGYLVHLRMQARMDAAVDALHDLSGVSTALSEDADATTALPRAVDATTVDLPTRAGLVRWTATPAGLERKGPDGRGRSFPSLRARSITVETVGARMVLLALVRGPCDTADTALARAIPIGSQR